MSKTQYELAVEQSRQRAEYYMSCYDDLDWLQGLEVKKLLPPSTIVLTDGTKIVFNDQYECCAYWEFEIFETMEFPDGAIITNVKSEKDTTIKNGGDTRWVFTLIFENKKIAQMDIVGNPGSGYYMDGVTVTIKRSEEQ